MTDSKSSPRRSFWLLLLAAFAPRAQVAAQECVTVPDFSTEGTTVEEYLEAIEEHNSDPMNEDPDWVPQVVQWVSASSRPTEPVVQQFPPPDSEITSGSSIYLVISNVSDNEEEEDPWALVAGVCVLIIIVQSWLCWWRWRRRVTG